VTNTSRKAVFGGLALVGSSALLLAGCAAPPEETDGGGNAAADSDFTPCIVSDFGGFDDKSFNQISLQGVIDGAEELGVDYTDVESNTEADYAPNLQNLVAEDCGIIVSVGFALAAATVETATANPDVSFAIIDDAADGDFDGEADAPNIKPILFDTAGAAFLAGYAAASYTETGIVGTYGGQEYPTVTIFMDGFKQGVDYHNEQKGTDVQVRDGGFIGSFDAGTDSRNAAQGLIDQNVDVLLPVGGPIYQSAAEAIRDSGKDIVLVGTDADLYETDETNADLVLTSILKNMALPTAEVVVATEAGDFDGAPYIGTLENDGVGIAPFHDYEGEVAAELQGELDDITASIIAGDIEVESYLAE
jgi:basic membrane protein A